MHNFLDTVYFQRLFVIIYRVAPPHPLGNKDYHYVLHPVCLSLCLSVSCHPLTGKQNAVQRKNNFQDRLSETQ